MWICNVSAWPRWTSLLQIPLLVGHQLEQNTRKILVRDKRGTSSTHHFLQPRHLLSADFIPVAWNDVWTCSSSTLPPPSNFPITERDHKNRHQTILPPVWVLTSSFFLLFYFCLSSPNVFSVDVKLLHQTRLLEAQRRLQAISIAHCTILFFL